MIVLTTFQAGDAAAREPRREAGPLFYLRLSFSGRLWRMGAAWSALAGAVASGVSLTDSNALLRLIGTLVLADPAWGVLWQMTLARERGEGTAPVMAGILPYAQPAAPASNIVRQLRAMSATAPDSKPSATGWHELIAGLGLTLGLSLLLGLPALALSMGVICIALAAWALNRRGMPPALGGAFLTVGMPWALGVSLAKPGSLALTSRQVDSTVLALAFTALAWGVRRAQLLSRSRARGVWLGQAATLAVLIGLRQPWTVAVVAVIFLPPTLWLMAARDDVQDMDTALARSAAWWWMALLLAAAALR